MKQHPAPWRWVFFGTFGNWNLVDANDNTIPLSGPPDMKPTAAMRAIAETPDLITAMRSLAILAESNELGDRWQTQEVVEMLAKLEGGAS